MTTHRSPFQTRLPSYRAQAQGTEAEMRLYDEVGFFGIDAKTFEADVASFAARGVKHLHLRVNSPGGDVFDGVAMANALRRFPGTVTAHVDGLAASIASIIVIAADEVVMAPGAFLMIHNPFTIAIGDAAELRAVAQTMDKVESELVDLYATKTGRQTGKRQIANWMADETWFTGDEAVAAGLADRLETEPVAANALARFDLRVYRHTPEALLESSDSAPTVRDFERALREAGLSGNEAKIAASAARDRLTARDVPAIDPDRVADLAERIRGLTA